MDVLPPGCLRLQEIAQRSTVLRRRFFPIFLDRIPAFAQTLFVSVSILRNDGSDAFGMCQRKPQSHRSTVIKDVNCKARQANCLREVTDDFGQVLKRVPKTISVGSIGEAK